MGYSFVFHFVFIGNLANGDIGLAAIPGREAEFKQSLQKSIEYAQALGCNKYIIKEKCIFKRNFN